MMTELEHLAGLLTGRALFGFVMAYAVCPYAVLWLAVRCWPPDDSRRGEYLGEYEHVPLIQRPVWVGDVAIRCLLDGCGVRARSWRKKRTLQIAASEPRRTQPSWLWFIVPRAGLIPVPFCTIFGIPEMVAAAHLLHPPAWIVAVIGYVAGKMTLHSLYRFVYIRRHRAWRRANERLAAMAEGPT